MHSTLGHVPARHGTGRRAVLTKNFYGFVFNLIQTDFVLYPFGITIGQVDAKWIKQFLRTKNGTILVFSVAIAGFIMMTFYRTVLLSYLTAINYEKAIEDLDELVESDLKIYVFRDDTTSQLADSSRESEQKLWAKITKDNTYVKGNSIEMQEAIIKRSMGQESLLVPNFDYSAHSSKGNIQLLRFH